MDREWIPRLIGAAVGAAAWAYGQVDPVVWVLAFMIVADIFSGVLAGGQAGELSSERSWLGMRKKAMMILFVCVGYVLESQVPLPAGTLIAGAFVVTELISILENASRLDGFKVPPVLLSLLAQLEDKHGKADRS